MTAPEKEGKDPGPPGGRDEDEMGAAPETGAGNPETDQDPDPPEAGIDPRPIDVAALEEQARQAAEYQERWMRTAADLQNLQRRLQREKEMARRMAVRDLIQTLLPCFDNLERAVRSAEGSSSDALVQGVSMVSAEIRRILREHGVEVIDPADQPLDPNLHEAVASRHDADVEENSILEVHEKGYALGDMVIRPARVTVSLGPAPEASRVEGGQDGDAAGPEQES